MKRIVLLCGCLLVWSSAGAQLTLDSCRLLARNHYPEIRRYDLVRQTEEYTLSNARREWLPQLSLSAQATWQTAVPAFPDALTGMLTQYGVGMPGMNKDQYKVQLEVTQTIWDGGSTRSARALTRAEAIANREQLESELYALNDRVNQIYFGCLLQDELIRQNALLQKELQVNIERIKAMMDNGVANQSDLESMEVELLNARQNEIELRASRTVYRQMLATFINKPLTDQVVLKTPESPERSLSTQINRPELRALDAKSEWIETQNKQVTAGLMPRIGAFVQGGYGRPGLNMLEDSFEPYYVAGVRLSWNLGKLYTLKNDRRKIEVSRRQIDVQRETFLFNTRLQLLQQNTEIKKMTDLMRADDDIIRLRTSIKQAAEVKLENGVISVTDLIREINAEDMARQTAAAHRVQRLMTIYNYMYTTN